MNGLRTFRSRYDFLWLDIQYLILVQKYAAKTTFFVYIFLVRIRDG